MPPIQKLSVKPSTRNGFNFELASFDGKNFQADPSKHSQHKLHTRVSKSFLFSLEFTIARQLGRLWWKYAVPLYVHLPSVLKVSIDSRSRSLWLQWNNLKHDDIFMGEVRRNSQNTRLIEQKDKQCLKYFSDFFHIQFTVQYPDYCNF